MSQPLPSYPDYKPAGLPWLAEVPAHWDVKPLGTLLRERGQNNDDGAITQVLSVMKDKGVVLYEDKGNVGNKKSEDTGHYKIVQPGDLVMNSMNVIIGSVGLSRYQGCLSQVYYVLTRRSAETSGEYIEYLFRNRVFQHNLTRIGNGILAHRMRIPMELLKREGLPLPPLPEQQRIVTFLNGKTRQIARLLRNKRQLIKLLTEQRQNVIQRAVLYGINPDVRLKPSGVEWFTEVPVHWSVKKLKHLATVRSGIAKGKAYLDGEELVEVSYLRVANVQDGYLSLTDVATIQVTKAEAQSYKLEPFDLLMNEGGDIDKLGRGTVWHGEIENCIHQNHVFALRPKPKTNVYFLNYFVGAPACKKYFQLKGKQTTNLASISSSAIAATPIALPTAEEQQAIVDYIEKETKIIDQTIARAQREIELIQEYRTRLIADVVTGRVDVQHLAAAAPLPALPTEPELDLDDEEESEEELLLETEDERA